MNRLLTCFKKFQIFPTDDDGVPPGCHNRFCLLSNSPGAIINSNFLVIRMGHCGLKHFDEFRLEYFGFASFATVVGFILALYGCFSLSTNNSLVQRTYWVGGSGTNFTSNHQFSMYVGLRSFEYVDCQFIPGYESYAQSCDRQSIKWTDDACVQGPVAPACRACATVASTMWATAFFNCVGLIFAFLGAQTRMRIAADIPVQKFLGVFAEAWCVVTLGTALLIFESKCYFNLRQAVLVPTITASFYVGPGLYCYAVCCTSALIRMIVHWLTPLPSLGVNGCCGSKPPILDSHSRSVTHIDVEMVPIETNEKLIEYKLFRTD